MHSNILASNVLDEIKQKSEQTSPQELQQNLTQEPEQNAEHKPEQDYRKLIDEFNTFKLFKTTCLIDYDSRVYNKNIIFFL